MRPAHPQDETRVRDASTVSTGHGAVRTTRSATLPISMLGHGAAPMRAEDDEVGRASFAYSVMAIAGALEV
jgi:hypothetical protein